ncbi:MAG: type II toxin-antitoxin system RelE/ParE family toxin [Polyangiaceae bacterium]
MADRAATMSCWQRRVLGDQLLARTRQVPEQPHNQRRGPGNVSHAVGHPLDHATDDGADESDDRGEHDRRSRRSRRSIQVFASPGNNLEKLKGNLAGCYSVRINDQWRILFAFEKGQANGVRIADYH